MFYGQCWKCGERWGLGTAPTCTCPDEALAEQPAQQVVDSEEKAGAYMEERLWEFIDMAAAWPKASPDPRTWDHVVVYAPKPAQRTWVGLTEREVELIDGMIEVQLHHAAQCDHMANRTMADKQKGWDMERVELLRKLKENT